MPDKPVITPLKDGPLAVTPAPGDPDARLLRDADGEVIDAKAPFALCRCGASANKPFCDGAHVAMGFTTENTCDHSKDRVIDFEGTRITVHNNPERCSSARYCVDDLPRVFRAGQRPWCLPDEAPVEDVIDICERCPSGALWYTVDGETHTDIEGREPGIKVSRDGPYEITGGICLQTDDGCDCSREHYTLCRCGAAANEPYCDGSHWKVHFVDPE